MDKLVERSADIATYSSASGMIIAGLTLNEWGVILGIFFTILFGSIASYIKYQHLKLAREQAAKGLPVAPPPHDDI